MANPAEILEEAYARASASLLTPSITNPDIARRVDLVARNEQNRAGVRFLLACALAKADRPEVDIRKPYTEIGDKDAYSGREYDKKITPFINKYKLPCNPTTGFLTSALRNQYSVLTLETKLVGRPAIVYQTTLQLLNDVFNHSISAHDLLSETIRVLILVQKQNQQRLEALLQVLAVNELAGSLPLSSEQMVKLIEQHLASPQASRLPVLVIAAIYKAATPYLHEQILPLQSHNAADEQTGSLGDIEITLINETRVVTSYEVKLRRVTIGDIERALQKLAQFSSKIDNYIFITTEPIEESVSRYAATLYNKTGGTEVVVLDCIGFLRHFLHLFYRLRVQFLDTYQELLLAEPESAVRQSLKETFLTLRRAAETATTEIVEDSRE